GAVSSSEASWTYRPSRLLATRMVTPSALGPEVVEPARLDRRQSPIRGAEPHTRRRGDFPDPIKPGGRGRRDQEPAGVLGRDREAQLEVLAVIEGMLQG